MKKLGENGTTESPVLAETPEVGLQIRWIDTDLQRILLSQNDALVVFSEQSLCVEARAQLEALLHAQFPGHRCLLFDGGLRLGVLSEATTP